jgi:hypothetical protein
MRKIFLRKYSLPLVLLIILTGLFSIIPSCGGGGGGSSSPPSTPIGTAVNLSQMKSYLEATAPPGSTASFQASGTSNTGVQLTGTFSFTVTGPTTTTTPAGIQTVNVVQQYTSITIISTGATISGISTDYIYQTGYLYKRIDSDGTIYTPISQTLLPVSAKVGDSGNDATLSISDGSTETSTWRIDPGTNGDAILVFNFITTNSLSQVAMTEEDDYTIKPDGTVSALSVKAYDATSGITITMSGNRI